MSVTFVIWIQDRRAVALARRIQEAIAVAVFETDA